MTSASPNECKSVPAPINCYGPEEAKHRAWVRLVLAQRPKDIESAKDRLLRNFGVDVNATLDAIIGECERDA